MKSLVFTMLFVVSAAVANTPTVRVGSEATENPFA